MPWVGILLQNQALDRVTQRLFLPTGSPGGLPEAQAAWFGGPCLGYKCFQTSTFEC